MKQYYTPRFRLRVWSASKGGGGGGGGTLMMAVLTIDYNAFFHVETTNFHPYELFIIPWFIRIFNTVILCGLLPTQQILIAL